jgi:ribosomal protein S8
MIVNQDTLEQIFYFILNHVDKEFTVSAVIDKLKNNNLEKFYPDYFVEALIQEGFLADFLIRKEDIKTNESVFSLTVRGKARAEITSATEVKTFLKMIIDEWS